MAGPTICGCCGGLEVSAPSATFARAGLASVGNRTGTYWSFRDSLLARLTSSDFGVLADLKSRDPAVDFSIALIDAWASAGDVLSFYNERLSNETLLGTAQERLSLHLLADMVGYRPSPGVAASARLAFTMAESPGAPGKATLASGIKVQSTPGPDEQPVLFETTTAIEARPAWNAIRPLLNTDQSLTTTTSQLFLSGTQTGLRPGDALLFFAGVTPVFARITAVTPLPADPAKDPDRPALTSLSLTPLATAPLANAPQANPMFGLPNFPPTLAGVLGTTLSASDLDELLAAKAVDDDTLFGPLATADPPSLRVLAFRATAGTFGKTAPAFRTLPTSLIGMNPVYTTKPGGQIVIKNTLAGHYKSRSEATWADSGTLNQLATAENYVYLDRVVDGVAADSAVVLVDGTQWGLYRAVTVAETAVSDFAITGKSTRIKVDTSSGLNQLSIRGTSAWVVSEWIDLPRAPLDAPLRAGTTTIPLDGFRPGIEPGQPLVLTGTMADGVEAPAAEHATIAAVSHVMTVGAGTTITLAAGLAQDFDRRALRINANVADATHGETRFEILGSGGGRKLFPGFAAKQGPLTYVTAEVPGGGKPALTLRVNGIEWKQVPNLLDTGPEDRVYTLALSEKGEPKIGFGDGSGGALPPAGPDNITLDYRVGLGLSGRVKAGQLNLLMSRPLGLDGVSNPLPSEGGANPEAVGELRANLPLFCRTMDRVVSLSDFADFALTYTGIAKARAERVKVPGLPAPGVALTVSGEQAAAVPPTSDLHKKLRKALGDFGIPFARFQLRDHRLVYFHLAAKIVPDPAYIAAEVLTKAEKALREAFGFEARDFAQTVYDSQLIEVLQQVPGVIAVMLDRLYTGALPQRRAMLPAASADALQGAELLLLHPGPLDWLETAA